MAGIRKKTALFIVFLIFSWVALPSAQSQVFKWTDHKGVVHFADDLGKIPPEYRNKIDKEYKFKEPRPESGNTEMIQKEKKEEKKEKRPQ